MVVPVKSPVFVWFARFYSMKITTSDDKLIEINELSSAYSRNEIGYQDYRQRRALLLDQLERHFNHENSVDTLKHMLDTFVGLIRK